MQVIGSVDGWDLPSLSTRYSDACQQLNTSKTWSLVIYIGVH